MVNLARRVIQRRAVAPEAKSPTRDLWRTLHRIARSGEPEVRRRFLEAVEKMRAGVDLDALERALEAGDVNAAMRAIPWATFDREFGKVRAASAGLHGRGAKEAAAALADGLGMTLAFDLVNERSVTWAEQYAAELVREVGQETERAIREVVTRGFTEGNTAQEMRQQIYGRIGLTRRQQRAVENYRASLEAEEVTGARLDRMVARYVERTRRRRAENIARTETIRAAHAGTQDIWREAVALGYLPADVQRTWVVTPDDRLCPHCAPMHGQLRGLEEEFTSPSNGAATLYPPLHPSCRCSMALALPDE